MIELLSVRSTKVSLEAIRKGNGGLDSHRQSLLEKVEDIGNWASFPLEHLSIKDLAYLTAKTGHEFAILRGKNEDILFHGNNTRCEFGEDLCDLLKNRGYSIWGHSHPGEERPIASPEDRRALKEVGQNESQIISGMTGEIVTYSSNLFDI